MRHSGRSAPVRPAAQGSLQHDHAGRVPPRLLPRRGRHLVLGDLAARASLWNRRRKLALFLETIRPGPETRVVDVGVGDTPFGTEPGVAATHNFFEAFYPWPERITAVSDVPLPNFAQAFPSVPRVVADGLDLPFADDEFDALLLPTISAPAPEGLALVGDWRFQSPWSSAGPTCNDFGSGCRQAAPEQ